MLSVTNVKGKYKNLKLQALCKYLVIHSKASDFNKTPILFKAVE